MKVLHTLLPLIIAPTFFLTNVNQLQAGEVVYTDAKQGDAFTLSRAMWRERRDMLVLRGTGTPGEKIHAFIAGTDQHLGSDTVNKRGYWGLKFYNQSSVPCGVRAVSGSAVIEKAVTRAPADCISADVTTPVEPENTPPVISGTPSTSVDEGQAYRFAPNANDADGDNLTFSIANRPSWANFNSATGVLSGTPDSASVGAYDNIVISVSDGSDNDSLSGFRITVNEVAEPNNAPVISGTAASSVTAGTAYSFAPNASDEDNDELSFSVSNLPSWASFNNHTGAVSGSPDSEDVGLYENIVISVSDGEATASLSPVDITVVEPEPVVGDVSLAWVAPTTRTDGSSLDMSEIGGYKVYIGTTDNNLEQVVDLADSSISDYVVEDLDTGDYYFAVTTYDTEGNESSYSNVVMKSTM